jgi:small GTP-binding protein
MDAKTLKIMVLGLANVGKTSILRTLERKYSLLGSLTPTKGIERSTFKIFGFQVSAWDLGGQEEYRKAFLQKNVLFEETDLIIFVVDVKDAKNYEVAFDFYQKILEILTELNPNTFPPILILLNKVDPDTKNTPEIRKNIKILTDIFQEGSSNFKVDFFETSIYDEWSLIKAFSHGLRSLSTKTELLSQNLAEFAQKILANAIILLNQNGYLIAEYANEMSAYSCQSISTQCMYMYLVLKERNITPEKITVDLQDQQSIVFREVDIEDEQFFIIFSSKESSTLELFNEYFPKFAEQTKDIIKVFFT